MKSLILRDLKLAFRSGGGFALTLAFFLIVVMFVPFGVGANPELLARIAPGILWIGALLSCLLSLDRIFQLDWEDGTLEALATSPIPLSGIATAKALAHWITTGLPITIGRHPDPFLHRRVRCGDHRRHKTGRLVTVPVGSTPLHPNLNAGRTGRNSGDAKPLTVAGTCRRYFAFMHCADPKRLRHSATRKFTLTKVTTCLFHCGRKRIETPHVFMGIRKSSQVHGAFRTHPACDYNCIGGYVANRTDLGVLFYTS